MEQNENLKEVWQQHFTVSFHSSKVADILAVDIKTV